MIAFKCPVCRTNYLVNGRYANRKTTCPKCGTPLRVPVASGLLGGVTESVPCEPVARAIEQRRSQTTLAGRQRTTPTLLPADDLPRVAEEDLKAAAVLSDETPAEPQREIRSPRTNKGDAMMSHDVSPEPESAFELVMPWCFSAVGCACLFLALCFTVFRETHTYTYTNTPPPPPPPPHVK
jgi:hypothetical protein